MVLVSLAAALLALQTAATPSTTSKADPNAAVTDIFATQYCADSNKKPTNQPYCGETLPVNVQWLVLYSLCTAEGRDAGDDAVCTNFETKVIAAEGKHERKFLTYSPRLDQWSGVVYSTKKRADKCEKGTPDSKKWYCANPASDWLDIDETGLATITRSASTDIPVVISGTNPLLYQTTPESVTSEDIAALASLQELALGLGGALQAAVGIYGKSKADFSVMNALQATHRLMVEPPAPDEPPEPAELMTVVLLYDQVVAKMAGSARDVGEKAGAANLARSKAVVAIQEVEQSLSRPGVGLTVPVSQTDHAGVAYSALTTAYATLDTDYRAVRDFGADCRPLLNEFLFIMQHVAAPEDVLRPRLQAYLDDRAAHGKCTNVFRTLALKLDEEAGALIKAKGKAFADLIAEKNKIYNTSLTVIVSPPSRPDGADPKDPLPLDAALDLLTAKRNDALAAYNGLVTAGAQRQRYVFADKLVMTWLYAPAKSDQLPWDKLQTHAFSLKPDAPLSSGVTATHDETQLKYKLQSSRTTGLGVGVGTFYTKLSTPTFDAVTDPNNKDQKVVSQTDSSTLAGQLALFADWRFISAVNTSAEKWFVRPSLQIGTNVSSTPGFFTGFSLDIFKYFRFGIGRTWQQSKMLDASQTLDKTVVASKDDIKTRDFFDHDRYYSFMFALDSLPLFKKSDTGGGSTTGKTGGDAGSGDSSAAGGAGGDTAAAGTKAKKKGG